MITEAGQAEQIRIVRWVYKIVLIDDLTNEVLRPLGRVYYESYIVPLTLFLKCIALGFHFDPSSNVTLVRLNY